MDPQVLFPSESFPTMLAGERPLSRVHALVRLQVSRLREALSALSAAVRPLARVHAHVRVQTPRRREALPAVAAEEAPVPAVPVQVQGVQSGSGQTQSHGERRGVQVRDLVQECGPVRERHHAGQALIGPGGAGVQLCVVGERADERRRLLQLRGAGQRDGTDPGPQRERPPGLLTVRL